MAEKKDKSVQLSEDTKAIITVIVLVTAFPIGVIVMWAWTRWPLWLKILITFTPFVVIFSMLFLLSLPFLALKWLTGIPTRHMYQQDWKNNTGYMMQSLPTIADTSAWKKYEDPTYQFSLQYPGKSLMPRMKATKPFALNVLLPIQNKQRLGDCFTIQIWQNPQNLSVEDYIKTNIGSGTTVVKTTTVDGIEAKQTQDSIRIEGAIDIFVKKGNVIYLLSFNPGSPQYDQSTFQKIVTTFKFNQP